MVQAVANDVVVRSDTARIRPHSRFWRLLAEKIAFQEVFKK